MFDFSYAINLHLILIFIRMPIVSLSDWNQFLSTHTNAHLLQTGEWGELNLCFEWEPVRFREGEEGVQILLRKLRFDSASVIFPKQILGNSLG